MDWSKAKNLLIVAFVLTNIFLIYNILDDTFKRNETQVIDGKYSGNVEQYLNDNGINLDIPIPKEMPSLPMLVVRYKNFDPDKMAKMFLGKDYNKRTETFGSGSLRREIFEKSNKELIVEGNKRLTYRNKNIEDVANKTSPCRTLAALSVPLPHCRIKNNLNIRGVLNIQVVYMYINFYMLQQNTSFRSVLLSSMKERLFRSRSPSNPIPYNW
jgi:hypothetical protein